MALLGGWVGHESLNGEDRASAACMHRASDAEISRESRSPYLTQILTHILDLEPRVMLRT